MYDVIKLLIAVALILTATRIARTRPELAGLIAVMPLTGLIVMLWLWHDCQGDTLKMSRYTLGAIWGIIPAIIFFLVAFAGFRRQLQLVLVLVLSFAAWLVAALIHQYFLHKS